MELSEIKENQTTEFKAVWKDDYFKHVSAFSNAKGGIIYIGVIDQAQIVRIANAKRLLEEIPNKSIQLLGVVVDITINTTNEKEYLTLLVQESHTPISFQGKYYIRSGSTIQELKGSDLQHFILKKLGKSFDDLPCEFAKIEDINTTTVQSFIKKAVKANRLTSSALEDDLFSTLINLKLVNPNHELKNATLLLFGNNPLHFFSSVSFRIGRFGKNHHDLLYQDIIEGNIFEMPDKVLDILKSKYLIMPIRYEGLQRIETLEYPEDALREAILNAIIHKDYTGVHIQLSVYEDKIILWNPGSLPNEISFENLKDKHPSIPRNKIIADVFFKAGYIEAWGRGINKILAGFLDAGLPMPLFELEQIVFRLRCIKT